MRRNGFMAQRSATVRTPLLASVHNDRNKGGSNDLTSIVGEMPEKSGRRPVEGDIDSFVSSAWRLARFAIFFAVVHGWCLFVYAKGFLLTRTELHDHSSCERPPAVDMGYVLPDAEKLALNSWCGSEGGGVGGSEVDGPAFDRLVFLLVDAWRLDFAQWDNNTISKESPAAPFRNQMPLLHDTLVEDAADRSRLFRFVADAPTTTMQRLKALVTGGMPTFIDMSSNFNAPGLLEDTWVTQVRGTAAAAAAATVAGGNNPRSQQQDGSWKDRGRVVFVGDDTWTLLFPEAFDVAQPFPSFNVQDIHTVDDGVIAGFDRFLPEAKASTNTTPGWQVLIGHMLGVDHIGHSFSAGHQAMPKKLAQVDRLIRDTIDRLPPNTLFVVAGDHGMTASGDHGGASAEEANAALFVYSSGPTFRAAVACGGSNATTSCSDGGVETVAQVDLVPTLALLMGFPIPFSSVGMFIASLQPMLPKASAIALARRAAELVRTNALQVMRYITRYTEVAARFPRSETNRLIEMLRVVELEAWSVESASTSKAAAANDEERKGGGNSGVDVSGSESPPKSEVQKWDSISRGYRDLLQDVRRVCLTQWTQFDISHMATGAALLILWLTTLCIHAWRVPAGHEPPVAPAVKAGIVAGLSALAIEACYALLPFLTRATGQTSSTGVQDRVRGLEDAISSSWLVLVAPPLAALVRYAWLAWHIGHEQVITVPKGKGRDSPGPLSSSSSSLSSSTDAIRASSAGFGVGREGGGLVAAVVAALAVLHAATVFSNSFINVEADVTYFCALSCLLAALGAFASSLHGGHGGGNSHEAGRTARGSDSGLSPVGRGGGGLMFGDWNDLPQRAFWTRRIGSIVAMVVALRVLHEWLPRDDAYNNAYGGEGGLESGNPTDNVQTSNGIRYSSWVSGDRAIATLAGSCAAFAGSTGFALWRSVGVVRPSLHGYIAVWLTGLSMLAAGRIFGESLADSNLLDDGGGIAVRVIFPRATYIGSALGTLAVWISPIWRPQVKDRDGGMNSTVRVGEAAIWLVVAATVPSVAVVLGPSAAAPIVCVQVFGAALFVATGTADSRTVMDGQVPNVVNELHGDEGRSDATKTRSFDGLTQAVLWGWISSLAYFSTGHVNKKLSALRVNRAFVGNEDFNFYVSGFLLAVDTYGCQVMCAFAFVAALLRLDATDESRTRLACATVGINCFFIHHATSLALAVACVSIHRRHLMVWDIFAPRFMFDTCVTFLVEAAVCSALVLAALAGGRVPVECRRRC